MLIAPHPDDEALACSVILQKAVRATAAIRIVYVTDGDDNPWPQRAVERRWRLSASDRKRWGKLRRSEALAALRVLDIHPADVQFLALPDQGLTDLLLRDCNNALTRLIQAIDDWSPTDILAPSLSDIHPDHNAVAVMMRLIFADFLAPRVSHWNYLVHGRSPAFFDRAAELSPSEVETATKRDAIRRHQTQIKLSRRRFLRYARRPERFFRVERESAVWCDGGVHSVSRTRDNLNVDLRFTADLFRTRRGASFSFWVATPLGENARARSVFPAARPILKCWIARRIRALASPVTGAIHLPASSRFHCTCFRRSTICLSKSIGVRGSSMRPVGSRFQVCRV